MNVERVVRGMLLATIVFGATSEMAHAAREVLADQGDNYSVSGQNWSFPGDLFIQSTTIGSNVVTIPFALNIGNGAQSYSFAYDVHGRAVLLDGSGQPTTNFIAPLYSPTSTFVPDANFGGFIGFGPGLIDPQTLLPTYRQPGQTYNTANALSAYRFVWNNVCVSPPPNGCSGTNDLGFEAVLVNRGGGDFDLDFFYFDSSVQGTRPQDATGGFLLASNQGSITSFVAPGQDFCFRGGALSRVCAAATAIPEPSSFVLLSVGLLMLFGAALRRRVGSWQGDAVR